MLVSGPFRSRRDRAEKLKESVGKEVQIETWRKGGLWLSFPGTTQGMKLLA